MNPTFFAAAAQTLTVEITNGDMIDTFQVMDFIHFHANAMEKSGNNLKPVDWQSVDHSAYLVQVKNQAGATVGQCRLIHANPDCAAFGHYPAPEDGMILASLSGLKYFPQMMEALQQYGFNHITLKTRASNEYGKKVVETCGFEGTYPALNGHDDYESVFYSKALQTAPALQPSGPVNLSPVSLEGPVYAPFK